MTKKRYLSVLALSFVITQGIWSADASKASSNNALAEKVSTSIEGKPLATETEVAPNKGKKICKSSAPTGSRIGKKICLTKAAWDEMSRKARNTLDSSTKPTSNNKQGE